MPNYRLDKGWRKKGQDEDEDEDDHFKCMQMNVVNVDDNLSEHSHNHELIVLMKCDLRVILLRVHFNLPTSFSPFRHFNYSMKFDRICIKRMMMNKKRRSILWKLYILPVQTVGIKRQNFSLTQLDS